MLAGDMTAYAISIHTLTQRVTGEPRLFVPVIAISIHTLTQRVT